METRDFEETVCAFLTIITAKNRPKKMGRQRNNLLDSLKDSAKLKECSFYFKMKETKASFAEPTIQSLKKIFYPYMKDNWMQVHSQDVSICHNPEF